MPDRPHAVSLTLSAGTIVLPMDEATRLRRGIGSALLLASAVWLGVFYAVLLVK